MNRVTHKEWLARRPASSRDQPSICCPKGSGPKGLESSPGLNGAQASRMFTLNAR
jgi:hypothetical protein